MYWYMINSLPFWLTAVRPFCDGGCSGTLDLKNILKNSVIKSKFICFTFPSLSKRFERWAIMVSVELLSFTRWSMRKFNSCFEPVLGCCWLQRETECSFFISNTGYIVTICFRISKLGMTFFAIINVGVLNLPHILALGLEIFFLFWKKSSAPTPVILNDRSLTGTSNEAMFHWRFMQLGDPI